MAEKPGRPSKPEARKLSVTASVRMKIDLADWLDAKTRELEIEHPEVDWNRGQVIRHILYRVRKAEQKEEN